MRLPVIIAGTAGMAASFAVPLPSHDTARPAAPKAAGAAFIERAASVSQAAAEDWPLDAAFIARMSANDCGAALDRLLRYYACTLPKGESLDAAVALTMRLTDLSAAISPERHPLKGRRLPAWLLTGVTESYLRRLSAPPAGWMTAVSLSSAGRDAMTELTAELAVSAPDKAKVLAAACPDRWRRTLDRKVREGLAMRDPVAAAREAWEAATPPSIDPSLPRAMKRAFMRDLSFRRQEAKEDDRLSMLTISSQKGPVKETVAALALYADGGANDFEQQELLANLFRRDPAATRAAVEATGDPGLRTHLQAVEHKPQKAQMLSPVDTGNWNGPPRRDTDSFLGTVNPDEAARIDVERKGSVPEWLQAKGMTDPAQAFQWAKANDPDQLTPLFRLWVQTDGPAALHAALTLPEDNWLRRNVESGIVRPDSEEAMWEWRAAHARKEDALAEESPRHQFDDPGELMGPEIRVAARYVKVPDPQPAPAPASTPTAPAPAGSRGGSSLWNPRIR